MQIMLTDERIYSELLWFLVSVDYVMNDSSCIFFLVILVFSKVVVLCAFVLFVERNVAKVLRY